jgi:hypothetical protein
MDDCSELATETSPTKSSPGPLSQIQKLNNKFGQYYSFESVLGTGAFCTVYEAMDKETGELIAVKVSYSRFLNWVLGNQEKGTFRIGNPLVKVRI